MTNNPTAGFTARRRALLQTLAAAPLSGALAGRVQAQAQGELIRREIPGTAEALPVVGLGTFRVFDIGGDAAARADLSVVMRTFFSQGGRLIDSSPMYGPAEQMTGELLAELPAQRKSGLFAATKVWTDGRQAGITQMEDSLRKMGVEVMDLMQIHNLRDWRTHLPVLQEWKAAGRIRYIGVTTSSGRNHAELATLLREHPFDFVQFTYSIENRAVENDLFPIARDRGIAVLANRPFEAGGLFSKLRGKPLPAWAAEIDCTSWAQVMLKYVIAHPDVTCAIPATGDPGHLLDNMAAGRGNLPDATLRARMVRDIEAL